ncbi:MAG: Arc family DNA-binding protein [Oscillospiraceae bacterium]|nr:Arc family DNA-binding protein [Oscillospiraceae bacterium]
MKKKEKTVSFTLRLPADMAEKLSTIAEYNGRTRSAEIIQILRRHVKAVEQKNPDLFRDGGNT